MYADKPYTVIQRAVHIHPTVSELIPTMLGELQPLDGDSMLMLDSPIESYKALARRAWIRPARKPISCSRSFGRILCTTVPFRSGIGSFSISAIWKPSIGTCCGRANLRRSMQSLDRLFAFGIDPVDGGLPSDQPSDWPALEQVRRYARVSAKQLDALLDARRRFGNIAEHRDRASAHARRDAGVHAAPVAAREEDPAAAGRCARARPAAAGNDRNPEGRYHAGTVSRCRGLRLGQRIRGSRGERSARSPSIATK